MEAVTARAGTAPEVMVQVVTGPAATDQAATALAMDHPAVTDHPVDTSRVVACQELLQGIRQVTPLPIPSDISSAFADGRSIPRRQFQQSLRHSATRFSRI